MRRSDIVGATLRVGRVACCGSLRFTFVCTVDLGGSKYDLFCYLSVGSSAIGSVGRESGLGDDSPSTGSTSWSGEYRFAPSTKVSVVSSIRDDTVVLDIR